LKAGKDIEEIADEAKHMFKHLMKDAKVLKHALKPEAKHHHRLAAHHHNILNLLKKQHTHHARKAAASKKRLHKIHHAIKKEIAAHKKHIKALAKKHAAHKKAAKKHAAAAKHAHAKAAHHKAMAKKISDKISATFK